MLANTCFILMLALDQQNVFSDHAVKINPIILYKEIGNRIQELEIRGKDTEIEGETKRSPSNFGNDKLYHVQIKGMGLVAARSVNEGDLMKLWRGATLISLGISLVLLIGLLKSTQTGNKQGFIVLLLISVPITCVCYLVYIELKHEIELKDEIELKEMTELKKEIELKKEYEKKLKIDQN